MGYSLELASSQPSVQDAIRLDDTTELADVYVASGFLAPTISNASIGTTRSLAGSSTYLRGRKTTPLRSRWLIVLAVFVIASRCVYTILSQYFKELLPGRNLRVPVYITMVESMCAFVVAPVWLTMLWRNRHNGPAANNHSIRYRLFMYTVCAFLDGFNTLFASFGLSVLPPVVYTVVKSSTIAFSVIFSRLFTAKQFNRYHYIGAAVLVLSVAGMSLSTRSSSTCSSIQDGRNAVFGIICCFLSSMSLAMLGVCTYMLFVHENSKGDMRMAVEQSVVQLGIQMFLYLPLLASEEVSTWPDIFADIVEEGRLAMFVALSVGIILNRPITLFSVVALTASSSPVLVQALGGPRRCILIGLCLVLFKEDVPPLKCAAVVIMMLALPIYSYGGHLLSLQKRAEESRDEQKYDC